jgi:hypothetical protein
MAALIIASFLAAGPATAQTGPSELDALSRTTAPEFPEIDNVPARKPVSVTLRALNKVTAKYTDIVIEMGKTAKFGALDITARTCDKRPPEEFPETTAFIEIIDNSKKHQSDFKHPPKEPEHADSQSVVSASGQPALPHNMVFSGWMFASSPALSALEHPVYDVWVIDCKTELAGS